MTIMNESKPDSLPGSVSMRDLVAGYDPSQWNRLDLGIDAFGQTRGVDRYVAPHMLIAGDTGSGKTVALQMLAVQALTCGNDVVYINLEGFPDFVSLEPWMKRMSSLGLGNAALDGALIMEQVHTEVLRRFRLLSKNMCGFWMNLPDEVREREQVRPLTVIIDGFDVLTELDPVSSAMPTEVFERATSINESKRKLMDYAHQIARSGRAVGVHLAISTHRLGPEYLSGIDVHLDMRILAVHASD